jgi:hypothetical protein
MRELLVCLLWGGLGMCAGAALALGAGWLLGIRLAETGMGDDGDSGCVEPRTTLAAKVLMGVGGILGAATAILIALLVEYYSR